MNLNEKIFQTDKLMLYWFSSLFFASKIVGQFPLVLTSVIDPKIISGPLTPSTDITLFSWSSKSLFWSKSTMSFLTLTSKTGTWYPFLSIMSAFMENSESVPLLVL